MSEAILLTECLQADFVKPLAEGDPLPNLLHIGWEESRRLMGEDPSDGPVARVMRWAYAQPREKLQIIHLRDWHRPEDPTERAHLEHFGSHCVAGTPGSAFAFEEPEGSTGRVEIVDAPTLSDFQETRLLALLDEHAGRSLPVGIMGVWTEAKVTFLAYELSIRYPRLRLAVCSALTAGSSRSSHFIALEQLDRLLGVRVLSSVGEFIEFLGGSARDIAPAGFNRDRPPVGWVAERAEQLGEADARIVRYLFRDCRQVSLRELGGGYSGNRVFLASSHDVYGHEQAPHVVKVGPQELIGKERCAFERIEPVLGNNAPRVADFADLEGRGALKYRYASMGTGGASRTFQSLYMAGLPQARIREILEAVFVGQLGRLYAAATREHGDLLDYYGFRPEWAQNVRRRVTALVGDAATQPLLSFAGGRESPNLCTFYERELPALARHSAGSYYAAWVHGDLNGANIMIDGQGNVWLIDFFHAHRGHVLRDLVKLENDLLYIFTSLQDADHLRGALDLTDALIQVADLGEPLHPCPLSLVAYPQLVRAWDTIATLRSFYGRILRDDRDPAQLLVAQLRYAAHTLSFDESSHLQKLWALYAAGRFASEIVRRRSGQTELNR